MTRYPLIFRFSDIIVCTGFAARIHVNGRMLPEEENGRFWVYGVNPGALAEHGDQVHQAVANFLTRLKMVLVEFAEDASSLESFQASAT